MRRFRKAGINDVKIKDPLLAVAIGLLVFVLPSASMAAPPSPFFVELGHRMDNLHEPGKSGFVMRDVDGDGFDDLVFSAWTAYRPNLFVFGRRQDGSLGFKQSTVIPDQWSSIRVLARAIGDTTHFVTVNQDGMVRDFAGWPLVEQYAFAVDLLLPNSAAVGDVDNDGVDELVVGSNFGLAVYSMETGALEWTNAGITSHDVALAQLDADPALEIVIAGFPGLVLDGATHATDWELPDGFLQPLATGWLTPTGAAQWFARLPSGTEFGVFGSSPWSLKWSRDMSFVLGAAATVNLDGAGPDDLLLGDLQSGLVAIVDSTTHQNLLAIPFSANATSAVAAADLDGDELVDIAIAAVAAEDEDPELIVADGLNGSIKWSFIPTESPYSASEFGDLDGDGKAESVAYLGGYNMFGNLVVFDAYSGEQEWRSPSGGGSSNPFNLFIRDVNLVPKHLSTGMNIVLAGSGSSGGSISVVDGITMQSILQIGAGNPGPMSSRQVNDIQVFDYDGDEIDDYLAATSPVSTGTTGALLQVFSGADGSLLWTSPVMGGDFADIYSVLVIDHPAGQAGKDMVAVLPDSLRAYDSSTGLLSWVLPQGNTGAIYIPDGVAGSEFGVISGTGTITFFDTATRQFLRAVSLPGPIGALRCLEDDVHTLLVVTGDVVSFVDGVTGTILAQTDSLALWPVAIEDISAMRESRTSWLVNVASQQALYRLRLQQIDQLFADSFEIAR